MINNNTSSPQYFAASNSGRGFISYFDKVFSRDRLDRIYILKGGPGTGKSSLMRAAEQHALSLGHTCEVILCSSDIGSYDGVMINTSKERIAILDGTAPHIYDARIPGAVDETVDLGRFWNGCRLRGAREQIQALIHQKSSCYACAYAMLGGAEGYAKERRRLLERCIDREKLKAVAERALSCVQKKNAYSTIDYKLKNAISSDGYTGTSVYSVESGTHIAVRGAHGAAFAFFDALFEISKSKGADITLSPSPLSPDTIDAIAILSEGLYFYSADSTDGGRCDKVINTERFLRESELREIKPTLRLLSRLERDSMDASVRMLCKAKEHHLALEDIYIRSMDFDSKEKMQAELIQGIM